MDAALAFAAGLVCAQGGCGECNACRRVREGLHPDVELVTPAGNLFRVEEVREAITHHAAYRPFEADSRAKVFIVTEAEALRGVQGEPANHLLKTLEEPPRHVYFILVADRLEDVIPTLVSRCQVVEFRPVPAPLIAGDLVARHGLSFAEASLIARVAEGDLEYARELADEEEARRRRDRLLDLARDLPAAGLIQTEAAADAALALAEEGAPNLETRMTEELERRLQWAADAREREWLKKRHDQLLKRRLRRLRTERLVMLTRVFAGWYRDLALVSLGAEAAVLNQDRLEELRASAVPGCLPAYHRAVLVVRRTRDRLRYNVDARCTIGDMFRSIKEALTEWPMS